jgi:hypothetical protein
MFSFHAEGYHKEVVNQYQKSFWNKVIGVLVSIFVVGASGTGLWLYYQKYGNLTPCKNFVTCKFLRGKLCKNGCNICKRGSKMDRV